MRRSAALISCLAAATFAADTLSLRNGSTVTADIQSLDGSELRVLVNGATRTFPVADVATISFGERPAVTPAPAAAASGQRLPAGTVVIRTIDSIDSKTSQVGQTFRASLDEPVMVNGKELVKGSDAVLKLVEATSAGKLRGSAQLSVMLISVTAGGVTYEANTENVKVQSAGKGKGSAGKIGIGAGLGGAVGGLLGGKKGAAIGAGAGAGAGTTVALATGPSVQIASETRLTFQVQ